MSAQGNGGTRTPQRTFVSGRNVERRIRSLCTYVQWEFGRSSEVAGSLQETSVLQVKTDPTVVNGNRQNRAQVMAVFVKGQTENTNSVRTSHGQSIRLTRSQNQPDFTGTLHTQKLSSWCLHHDTRATQYGPPTATTQKRNITTTSNKIIIIVP